MADKRITELSAVSVIDLDNDLLPIINGGFTKKITARALADNFESISYQGSDLKALSANWQSTYEIVSANSESWQNAYTAVAPSSAVWTSTYSTVSSLSSFWQDAYTVVAPNSANWQNVYTAVAPNSANWQNTHTTVAANSAIWGAVTFNNEVTYTNVLTGLNEMLRLNIGGVTRYIRLFDIGTEQYLFASEDAIDIIGTEDGNHQLMFSMDPEIFLFGTEDEEDFIVSENNQFKLRFT